MGRKIGRLTNFHAEADTIQQKTATLKAHHRHFPVVHKLLIIKKTSRAMKPSRLNDWQQWWLLQNALEVLLMRTMACFIAETYDCVVPNGCLLRHRDSDTIVKRCHCVRLKSLVRRIMWNGERDKLCWFLRYIREKMAHKIHENILWRCHHAAATSSMINSDWWRRDDFTNHCMPLGNTLEKFGLNGLWQRNFRPKILNHASLWTLSEFIQD